MPVGKKLRIVQVIPNLRKGGAERLVLDISLQLIKLGHEVFIITFEPGNEYSEITEGLNIEVIPSEVSYSITGKGNFNTQEFDNRVRYLKPDIIHSHLLEAEFASRHNTLEGVIYITHWHGCHPATDPRPIYDYLKKDTWWNKNSIKQLSKRYVQCNNQFLCISDFIRNYVSRAFKSDDQHLHVILNGIDLSNFKYEKAQKHPSKFVLLSVGSLRPFKNQIFLLHVMKKLKEDGHEDIVLRLLGGGSSQDNLETFTRQNALQDMVEFLGYDSSPGHHLNRADVMVHATVNEGFGLVFLEAMSCRIPVVAFRSGGIPEIVQHEKTGLLSNVNDVNSFVQSILRLKKEQDLCKQYGIEGQKAVQQFEIGKYTKRIEGLYLHLLKKQQD